MCPRIGRDGVRTILAILFVALPLHAQYMPLDSLPAHPPAGPVHHPPGPVHHQSGVADLTPEYIPPAFEGPGEKAESHPGAILATGEYLLFRPRRTDAGYALVDPVDNLTPEGGTASVNGETRSGFRAALGYRLPDSPWEAKVWYTYFDTSGASTAAAPPGGVLYPTLTRPGLIDRADRAGAEADVRIHQFDGEFGRAVCIDESLTVRLAGGLRFLSLDQGLNAYYQGGDAVAAVVLTRSDFFGVGPQLFSEGEWKVGRGFGLFANARASLVYGTSRNSVRESNFGGAVTNANFEHDFAHTVPGLDVNLGVSWRNQNLHFRVGYAFSEWFNLGGIPRLSDDFSEGRFNHQLTNLGLDGFFFQGGVTY